MLLDGACQTLAERIFRKLDTIDWNEYAEQVANIEQKSTETTRDTTVTYANDLKVSTYEYFTPGLDGKIYILSPRIQYSFPIEIDEAKYQLLADEEIGFGISNFNFTLLDGSGKVVATASGGDRNDMEISVDRVSAQLLETALNNLAGLNVHIREDRYVLEASK